MSENPLERKIRVSFEVRDRRLDDIERRLRALEGSTAPEKPDDEAQKLLDQGYSFKNRGICTGPDCGTQIEWWITPNNKPQPRDPGTLVPHWTTCPNAGDFRKNKDENG